MASIDIFNSKVPIPEWVARGLDFDRAFSAKVMAGKWRDMKKEDILYGSIQFVMVIAVAACGLVDRGFNKPPELPAVPQSIGLVTETTAGKDPATLAQLYKVRSRSSNPANCKPQEIVVNSSKGPEIIGVCRVVRTDGLEGSVIVSRESKSGIEIINEPLLGFRQKDGRIIVGYQYGDRTHGVSQVLVLNPDGSSRFVYGNGMTVDFDVEQTKQAGFDLTGFIGQLIAPSGVAVAAEIDTLTPTATVTATAIPATPPTEASTPVPATEVPAQFKPAEYYINKSGGQWVDAGPGRHIWKKAPQILVSFGGTAYEYGSIAGVVFKEIIMAEDGLQKALFGFNRGEDKYLFTVAVVPATCKSDKGYAPSGFDLLRDENGVNLYPIYKGSPKAILVNAGPCVVVNNLKVAQVDHIDAYFAGQKRDQAGKILDLSDQLALNDVR